MDKMLFGPKSLRLARKSAKKRRAAARKEIFPTFQRQVFGGVPFRFFPLNLWAQQSFFNFKMHAQ